METITIRNRTSVREGEDSIIINVKRPTTPEEFAEVLKYSPKDISAYLIAEDKRQLNTKVREAVQNKVDITTPEFAASLESFKYSVGSKGSGGGRKGAVRSAISLLDSLAEKSPSCKKIIDKADASFVLETLIGVKTVEDWIRNISAAKS